MEIHTMDDFRRWAKSRMALLDETHRSLAEKMGIAYPRISEALHGKPSGRKYILPLILALGGNPEDFQTILPTGSGPAQKPCRKKRRTS